MTRTNAIRFRALHDGPAPLVLVNIWDAGSARTVADAGAAALATGSWSMAAAHGLADGQLIAFDDVVASVGHIVKAVDIPVSVDAEAGYAEDVAQMTANIARLIDLGVAGINFEDSLAEPGALRDPAEQATRIAAIRARADAAGSDLYVNARCDCFLISDETRDADAKLADTIARCRLYADAGASGLFVPGLTDDAMIRTLCAKFALPVNVMVMGAIDVAHFQALGVRRISQGPGPYLAAMARLGELAKAVYGAA